MYLHFLTYHYLVVFTYEDNVTSGLLTLQILDTTATESDITQFHNMRR
jgi:hypothetical protein